MIRRNGCTLSRNTSGEQNEQHNWPTDTHEDQVPFQPSRHYVSASKTLEAAVAQVTLPAEENGAGERVPGLALIEADLDTPAQLRVFHPLKHEKRALDAPDFTKRGVQPVLKGIAGELADDQRSGHGAVPDGCGESKYFLLLRSNQFEVELAADQRSECWMVPLLARNIEPLVSEVELTSRGGETAHGILSKRVMSAQAGVMTMSLFCRQLRKFEVRI
jgi:hypothetical protein